MATARQAAIARTVLALAAVTNSIHVQKFDPVICEIKLNDDQKLKGTFSELGVQTAQLPAFRQILASFCPEISDVIVDPMKCPLDVNMKVGLVASFVEGNLGVSANFQGDCTRQ